MRTILALLFLAAAPANAASILYVSDSLLVGSNYQSWSYYDDYGNDGGHSDVLENQVRNGVLDIAWGIWGGSTALHAEIFPHAIIGSGRLTQREQPCSPEGCYRTGARSEFGIQITVDEDSPYTLVSFADGKQTEPQSGVLRAGELFWVGGGMSAGSEVGSLHDRSFSFAFSLGDPVPEPGTSILLWIGVAAISIARRKAARSTH